MNIYSNTIIYSENKVWKLIEFDPDIMSKVIKCKTVFKIKTDSNHDIIKYKVRFVATGYQQRKGIDYDEIFSPTLDATSLRNLFALAIKYNFHISSADVNTAYLNAEIDKDIYMEQPEFQRVIHPDKNKRCVCKLRKSIYGLKQSGKLWNQKITLLLQLLNIEQIKSNNNIFANKDRTIVIGNYVDDLIIL